MTRLTVQVSNSIHPRAAPGNLHEFPVILQGRKICVFPTRHGFVFFAMLFILLFGSVNHNNNLGFILTFLLGGMSFVSIFHTYRNISGLKMLLARAVPVFAGQQAVFKITVEASHAQGKALSFYFRGEKRTSLDLSGKNRQTVTVCHTAGRRGLLIPGKLCVTTTYPLGLFRGWSNLQIETSCLVYPEPIAGPIVADSGRENENNEGETGGTGVEDFAGLDAYQPGDPLQHISWKTYSRCQGLFTKKFEGQQGKIIYFDPEILPGNDLEKKLSRICFMILTAENIRLPYGLRIGNLVISPDIGSSHKQKCLRALALTGPGE